MPTAELENITRERQSVVKVEPAKRVRSGTLDRHLDHRPAFFTHGIRFVPGPSERDIYRTVLMTGWPRGTTMQAVLDRVRGGAIVSATITDTLRLTGTLSALIVFVEEHSATRFAKSANQCGLDIRGARIKVQQLSTPTWPMSDALREAVRKNRRTRCLELASFPLQISKKMLLADLRVHSTSRMDQMEHVEMSEQGRLRIRFTSIEAAMHASQRLQSTPQYRKLFITSSPDPCAGM